MLRLLRFALPSLLVAFAAAGVLGPVHSPDAFWHQAAGEWMLENGEIPRHDPFRYTSVGEPWVDHEWGFQLLLGAADAVGGVGAWVALRCLVFALLALLLWQLCRRILDDDRGLPGLSLILVVALHGLQIRAPVRPEILTLLAFTALLWILETDRRRTAGGGGPGLWISTALLTAAWANVHPGVLAAGPIVFLHLLGRYLCARRRASRPRPPAWPTVFGLPVLLVVAVAANPWGWDVLLLPLRIRSALAGLPASNPDWRPLWADPPWMLLATAAVVAVGTWLLHRRGVRPDAPSALVLLGTCGLTVVGLRFQGLAWIALSLFATHLLRDALRAADALHAGERQLAETSDELRAGSPTRVRKSFAPIGVAALLLVVTGLELFAAGFRPVGVEPRRFPEAGVDALQSWNERLEAEAGRGVGHLFHPAVYGGYLLYRAFPPRQVFLDTRNEVNPELLRELAEARSDGRKWHELVQRWDLDAALLRYEDRLRPVLGPPATPGGEPTVEHHTTSALLFPPAEWALVHWDDLSMLFLRRRADNAQRTALVAEREYRFVQPENVGAVLRRAARDPVFRAGLVDDVRRKLAEEPSSRRARHLAEVLHLSDAGLP